MTSKPYETGRQLLLIAKRKLHTVFRLIPTIVTLNDLERRNSQILLYSTEFDSFAGLSQWLNIDLYCLQNMVFHFGPKLTHPAARSLCDSWAIVCVTVNKLYSVSQKKVAPLKLFAIFLLRLSIFPWNFASLLPVYIHTCVPILFDLLWYLTKWHWFFEEYLSFLPFSSFEFQQVRLPWLHR